MYEDTFGTDWDDIGDREEAVRRAFALGVAARLGERHPGELDRISRAVDTSYDRSFVELAYHEGSTKAEDHAAAGSSTGDEEVWEDLVEGTTVVGPNLPDGPSPEDEEDLGPPELLEPPEPDSRPDDSREAAERPKFLTREGAEEPDREDRRSRSSRSSTEDQDDDTDLSDEDREAFQELLDPDGGSDDGE